MTKSATRPEPVRALRWVGDGSRYVLGIPTADLSEAALERLAGNRAAAFGVGEPRVDALVADLLESGLYEPADRTKTGTKPALNRQEIPDPAPAEPSATTPEETMA